MPFEHIQPLILMLHSGGRVLDDLRYIREDKALQETLKIKHIPLSQSTGNWLWETWTLRSIRYGEDQPVFVKTTS